VVACATNEQVFLGFAKHPRVFAKHPRAHIYRFPEGHLFSI
jgi:hypothetical protein